MFFNTTLSKSMLLAGYVASWFPPHAERSARCIVSAFMSDARADARLIARGAHKLNGVHSPSHQGATLGLEAFMEGTARSAGRDNSLR